MVMLWVWSESIVETEIRREEIIEISEITRDHEYRINRLERRIKQLEIIRPIISDLIRTLLYAKEETQRQELRRLKQWIRTGQQETEEE